jgi:hypothetical protein
MYQRGFMPRFNFSEDEQNDFFRISAIRDRVSDYFVAQLKHLLEEGRVHTESIVDEINYLEDPKDRTRTKKAKKFSGGRLKGFWHTHFFNGDVSQQATNYLKLLNKEGAVELIIKDIMAETDDPAIIAKKIAERIVPQQFDDITNKKSWTGDWVIYAKYEGKNYYLMICKHSSQGEDTDHLYYEMKEKCGSQYPFLFADE